MKKKIKTQLSSKSIFVLITIGIAVLVLTSAYLYYKNEESIIKLRKTKELQTISELKAKQISAWLAGREEDASIVSKSPFFVEKIKELSASNKNEGLKPQIYERLRILVEEARYNNVLLFSGKREFLQSVLPIGQMEKILIEKLMESCNSKAISNTDIYYSESDGKVYFDLICPIGSKSSGIVGFLVLRVEPEKDLFNTIQSWPVDSESSETVLIRKQGDSVLFLNRLRFTENSKLTQKFSLDKTDMIAVKALNGMSGIVSGKDYRGMDVLAYIESISNSNWFVVTKIDRKELYAEIYFVSGILISISIGVIVLIGVGLIAYYNMRQKNVYRTLLDKETELWKLNEGFKVTLESIVDCVITTDTEGRIEYMNHPAEEITGYNLGEVKGRPLDEVYKVRNELTGEAGLNAVQKVLKEGVVKGLANHTILISKSGREYAITDTGAPIFNSENSIIGVVLSFRDETEKRIQQRLLRESEELFSTTFRTSPVGITLSRLYDGKYLEVNEAFLKIMGFKREEVIGHTVYDLKILLDRSDRDVYLKLLKEKGKFHDHEIEYKTKNGELRYTLLSGELLSYKGEDYLLSVMHDITEKKKAEKALKESEARYRNVLDNMMEGCQIIGVDWRYQYVNNAVAKQGGYPKDMYLGKSMTELYPGIENTSMYKNLQVCMEKRIPLAFENEFFYPDGSNGYFELLVQPVPEGLFILSIDVTEQRKSQRELNLKTERFNRLISKLNDIIWTASTDGKTIYEINDAFDTIYGVSKEAFLYNPAIWLEMVHPDDKEIAKESMDRLSSDGYSVSEYRIIRPDGTVRWLLDRKSIIYDINKVAMEIGGIASDITERKEAEQELIFARDKAEEMSRIKSNFFFNISHELRTPFVGILGYAELLSEIVKEEEAKEMLEGITSTSTRLVDTLTKLLNVSNLQFEPYRLNITNVPLEEITASLIIKYENLAAKKGLSIIKTIKDQSISLRTDRKILFELLSNIMDNAIKFTDKGRIAIYVDKGTKNGKDIIIIRITDTGIGIPKEKQDIIWQEFRQVSEGTTRQYQGTGLGLTITKKYVELLNGEIRVTSEVGTGSAFIVELPTGSGFILPVS